MLHVLTARVYRAIFVCSFLYLCHRAESLNGISSLPSLPRSSLFTIDTTPAHRTVCCLMNCDRHVEWTRSIAASKGERRILSVACTNLRQSSSGVVKGSEKTTWAARDFAFEQILYIGGYMGCDVPFSEWLNFDLCSSNSLTLWISCSRLIVRWQSLNVTIFLNGIKT